MRLVCNANVLFAAVLKDSATRKVITHPSVELHSPDLLVREQERFIELLRGNTGADEADLDALVRGLIEHITIHEPSVRSLREARTFSPDKDDIAYLALALDLEVPLWTNDRRLKNQKRVRIVTTRDVLASLEL